MSKLLNDANSHALIDASLDHLRVSLDAAAPPACSNRGLRWSR